MSEISIPDEGWDEASESMDVLSAFGKWIYAFSQAVKRNEVFEKVNSRARETS